MKSMPLFSIVLFSLLAGCSANFPYGRSMDRHNFVSDPHMPKTILLIDSMTKQEVTRWDIPVGKKLVVDLEHEADWTASMNVAEPAHRLTWVIIDVDHRFYSPTHENHLALSGNPVYLRMYDTRKAPPRPQGAVPATSPTAAPAAPVKPDIDLPLAPPPPKETQPRPVETDLQPNREPIKPADVPPPAVEPAEPIQPQPGEPKYPLDEILEKQKKQQGSVLDSTQPGQPEPPDEQKPVGEDLEPDLPQ